MEPRNESPRHQPPRNDLEGTREFLRKQLDAELLRRQVEEMEASLNNSKPKPRRKSGMHVSDWLKNKLEEIRQNSLEERH